MAWLLFMLLPPLLGLKCGAFPKPAIEKKMEGFGEIGGEEKRERKKVSLYEKSIFCFISPEESVYWIESKALNIARVFCYAS
uniref:Putative secreted peptide n=1 Tax=Anopheles braziliensis TaxID=58242 RepID=A0A2M3ZS38_9DIPT